MRSAVLTVSCLFCLACSSQEAANKTVDRFERKMNDLRSFQAEQTSDLANLQEELRKLTGRVEQLEFRQGMNNQQAQQGVYQGTMQNPTPVLPPAQMHAGNDMADPPPIVPVEELEKDESMAQHIDSSIAGSFQDSLYFIRRGQFRQALPLLDQIVTFGQGKEGHVQALFWKGVCFDGMGNNRDALATYNEVIKLYPQNQRARKSLIRLASVFVRMGDSNTAKLTLQKLIAESPGSPEASIAKEKLADL